MVLKSSRDKLVLQHANSFTTFPGVVRNSSVALAFILPIIGLHLFREEKQKTKSSLIFGSRYSPNPARHVTFIHLPPLLYFSLSRSCSPWSFQVHPFVTTQAKVISTRESLHLEIVIQRPWQSHKPCIVTAFIGWIFTMPQEAI